MQRYEEPNELRFEVRFESNPSAHVLTHRMTSIGSHGGCVMSVGGVYVCACAFVWLFGLFGSGAVAAAVVVVLILGAGGLAAACAFSRVIHSILIRPTDRHSMQAHSSYLTAFVGNAMPNRTRLRLLDSTSPSQTLTSDQRLANSPTRANTEGGTTQTKQKRETKGIERN